MSKALKYSIFTFVIIVVALIIIPFFIPLNSYKGVIISKVKEATGRDLIINGDIKLKILPNPSVQLQEVKLSSIEGAKEPALVEVKEAKAALSLFSLITGSIEIASIELQEPTINLEILADGRKNWEMTKAESKVAAPKNDIIENNVIENNPVELPIFIKHIKIVNGKLTYITGKERKIFDNINLESKINSIKGPIDFTLRVNALGQQINITGNIAELAKIIPIDAFIDIVGTQIKVEGKFDIDNNSFIATAAIKGNSKNFGVPSLLQGDYELITSLIADDKQIVIKDARLNFKDIELTAQANYDIGQNNIKSNIALNPGNIVIDLTSNVDKSAIFNGDIKLQAQAIQLLLTALNIKPAKFPPVTNQKLTFTTNLIYNPQEITLQNINFIAANSNLQGMIKIKMQKDILVSHNLKINNADSFMSLFGVNSSGSVGSLQISGEVQKTGDIFQVNDKIGIFSTDILVKGNVNLSGTKPNFTLDLQSKLVNLDKIIAPTPTSSSNVNVSGQNAAKNISGDAAPWSNNPIDLSFLNSITGSLTASIDKLTQDTLVLDSLRVKLNIENGKLNISSITSNIYGGQLNISGYVQASKDQEASFKIDLKNAHLRNIVPQGGKIKVTEGQLSLKADLNSRGNSSYKYISNLGGKFSMNALNGKISGFDLNKIVDAVNNVKNADGIILVINSSFAGGETAFNNLAAAADIENGIVKLTECRLDASPAIATAAGQINLPQYMMDINASVTIGSLPPLGVKLYGFLNNPQHKLDAKALQTHLVKNVLNSVVKDLKKGDVKPENIIKNALGIGKKKSTEAQDNQQENNQENNDNKTNDPVNKLLQKGLKKLF
ncbi:MULTISPECIES: AsmA family protein [unclassified Rickettsia]|uniref:AsmA family protein n=1 Tax=unclassified Rickettsia TaxID=114295 RepID=UPI0031330DCB